MFKYLRVNKRHTLTHYSIQQRHDVFLYQNIYKVVMLKPDENNTYTEAKELNLNQKSSCSKQLF